MTFKVPEFDLADESIQFVFEFGGAEYRIPFMQYIPLPAFEGAQKRGGVGHIPVLEELGLDDAVKALKSMSPQQVKVLTDAWTKASTASLGESAAS